MLTLRLDKQLKEKQTFVLESRILRETVQRKRMITKSIQSDINS